MIKLTERLQCLADQIEQNETMADIGTDHGFLPIYLWENEISPKVIMADISAGSLEKARCNCEELYPGQKFDLRLGNGIQILENGEVDAVVIAGMGGKLMTQILEENMEKTRSIKKLVLQPRNGQGKLRYWLVKNNFSIVKESLVREGKYICEIITAVPELVDNKLSYEIYGCDKNSMEYETPPWITSAGELSQPFILNKIKIEEYALNGILKAEVRDTERETLTRTRIEYLKSLLGGVRYGNEIR